MKITACLLAMSDAEILGMVSPRTINDIKRSDPSPKLAAYVIGQEGEAAPKMEGVGSTIQRWFRSAIEALISKLNLGTPAYYRHPDAGEDRSPIGEVVGKLMKRVDDVVSAISVIYIYPQYRDLLLDVASIEAVISMPSGSRSFDVEDVDVQAVNGVALSNSKIDTPAFPGATLMAQLQAFAEKSDRAKGGNENIMTLEEIKKAIQENKLQPSDVFPSQVLISDPLVQERIEDMKDNLKMAGIRKLRESEEKVGALEAENKTLAEKLNAHEKTIIKTRASEVFDAVLAERPKLKEDERLSKFIRKQFEKGFTPTEEAKLKDDLNKFVDGQVAEYQELFGESKAKEKPKAEKPADEDGNPEETETDELLDPKKNDLIPQD